MDKEKAEKNVELALQKLNDPNLSEEEVVRIRQEALNNYSAALAEEFQEQVADAQSNAPKFTQEFFREHLGFAAAGIVNLATNSTSDSVRAQCCRDIIKYAIGDSVAAGDPWQDLLRDIAKKPQEHAPGATTEVTDVKPHSTN